MKARKTGRDIGKLLLRVGICAMLLAWIFQIIFYNQGKIAWERAGHDWNALCRVLGRSGWNDARSVFLKRASRIRPSCPDRHNVPFRFTQTIQVIRPSLHHLAALRQMRSAVVGAAVRVAYCVRELVLDVIGAKAQVFV